MLSYEGTEYRLKVLVHLASEQEATQAHGMDGHPLSTERWTRSLKS